MTHIEEKRRVRRLLKSQRRKLSPKELLSARQGLAMQARQYRQLLRCRRILSYSPISGEIDPQLITANLSAEIFLPKITHFRNGAMQFFSHGFSYSDKSNTLLGNSLGIAEPMAGKSRIEPRQLDAVLVPLVAFDRNGSRLGMGAGFYDRAFAFKRNSGASKRPLMVGLAHHFQEVQQLSTDPWDVPLDAIITDNELILI
jgi:5-formyltetrahydrofolate cyclo-ligase